MADKQWTVKDLVEALKQFPLDAKVYYEMGANGPGTIGKAQIRQGLGRGRSVESATGPVSVFRGNQSQIGKPRSGNKRSHSLPQEQDRLDNSSYSRVLIG
jgi:hypothetical protein